MKNKKINEIITSCVILTLFVLQGRAQDIPQLIKYADDGLYSVKAEFNVSGNWKGTEVQFDRNKTYIEEAFTYELNLVQEGNRISGNSYISDGQGNYSRMMLRGFVLGSKLHFEEHVIVEQVMKRPNSVWCRTTGELLIIRKDGKLFFSGSLQGYAPQPYICNETFVWFQSDIETHSMVSGAEPKKEEALPISPKEQHRQSPTSHEEGKKLLSTFLDSRNMMDAYPNPFSEEVTISFSPEISGNVSLEIFNMSGKKIATLINETHLSAPLQQVKFKPSSPKGIYLAVLKTNAQIFTRQLVYLNSSPSK